MFVLAIIGIIAYYAMSEECNLKESGVITNDLIEGILLGSMLVATILVKLFVHRTV